ncbi:MAG: Uma2 family endonuclease [Aphanocapsa lilacina HA4352-LM1]|jgi:Uma2 family endonuclease|nr:Uma2 family endonuclease [Aphanocapsa lilacina HA4352-LM1]
MNAFKPGLPIRSADLSLPTMYDLPSENPEEPGLPDQFHDWQPQLLSQTFRPLAVPPDQVFTAADLNLYYDPRNPRYYKRPDWFAVVGVPRFIEGGRLSYVRWQEGRSPVIVVELLSPNTIEEDQGLTLRGRQPPSKWEVYEQMLQVPYYVLFDRVGDTLQIFRLEDGLYKQQQDSRLWIAELGIGLGLWTGTFADWERRWLRWYDSEGRWIPSQPEKIAQEQQRAELERQRAELAEQRVQELNERLKAAGLDPEGL